jgi:hypothetical protein
VSGLRVVDARSFAGNSPSSVPHAIQMKGTLPFTVVVDQILEEKM